MARTPQPTIPAALIACSTAQGPFDIIQRYVGQERPISREGTLTPSTDKSALRVSNQTRSYTMASNSTDALLE